MAADAYTCPAGIDPAAAPLGLCEDCMAGAPIDYCPVVTLGNGALGCSCQSAGNAVSCVDPNVARCLPDPNYCPPLAICTNHLRLTCTGLSGSPADAGQCFIPGTGIVNPLDCTCTTTVVRQPKTPEQVAAHQGAANTLTAWAATSAVVAAFPFPLALSRIVKTVGAMFSLAAAHELALAKDPPDPDFTLAANPAAPPWTPVTAQEARTVTAAQAAALNGWMAAASELARASDRAATSGNRYASAVAASAPSWAEFQLSEWDASIPDLRAALAGVAAIHRSFASSTWAAQKKPKEPDMRSGLGLLADPADLAAVDLAAAADLGVVP